MSDRGGESSPPSIEIFDGRADTDGRGATQATLPLPVGQLLAIFGLLLLAVGAFTLASGADTSNPLGEPQNVGQLDCNLEGTVCRYTSPAGVVSWLCLAPCELPPTLGFGQEVFEFGGTEGLPVDGLSIGPSGELRVRELGLGEAGVALRVGLDGRIELDDLTRGDGLVIERGLLPSPELDDGRDEVQPGNEPAEIEASSPGSPGTSSGLDLDLGPIVRLLAPLAIIVGLGAFGFGIVVVVRSIRNRAARVVDDEIEAPLLRRGFHDRVEPEAVSEDPMAVVAIERVRIVSDLIEDLRAEPDPAVAIQRAYAALETGFGNPMLARRPSETCSTYLHRTMGVVGGVSEPLRTLTMLFELARYSTDPIDESMRSHAIDSLISVRSAWSLRASRGRP